MGCGYAPRQIRKSGSDGRIIGIAESPITDYLDHDLLLRVDASIADPCQEFVMRRFPKDLPVARDKNPVYLLMPSP
jgi:hypothetical protein